MQKVRVTATVDAELIAAGRDAVAAGSAQSFSGWVNDALRRQAEHDDRLRALGVFVAAYEAEHGALSDEEVVEARRRATARALVSGRAPGPARPARP